MTNLRPDEDIYPVTVYVDRRQWPVTWWFRAPSSRLALVDAMEYAQQILVPGCEVLLRADGLATHKILPADPDYVPAD